MKNESRLPDARPSTVVLSVLLAILLGMVVRIQLDDSFWLRSYSVGLELAPEGRFIPDGSESADEVPADAAPELDSEPQDTKAVPQAPSQQKAPSAPRSYSRARWTLPA